MAEVPAELVVRVRDRAGHPVADLMLRLEISTKARNPYAIPFGPTDERGLASVSADYIYAWADAELNLALMDFVPLSGGFAGRMAVAVMTIAQIEGALQAMDLYEDAFPYLPNYRGLLIAARDRLSEDGQRSAGYVISVDRVDASDPGQITISLG